MGGAIQMPGVTALHRVQLTIRDEAEVTVSQLQAVTDGEITISSKTGEFPSLVNLHGSSLTVEEGGVLTLDKITKLTRTNGGNLSLTAYDAGSLIHLPNVAESDVANYYQLEMHAFSGGEVRLPKLARFVGGIDVMADGEGSTVELPGFNGHLSNTSNGQSYLEARNGGIVAIPNITEVSRQITL